VHPAKVTAAICKSGLVTRLEKEQKWFRARASVNKQNDAPSITLSHKNVFYPDENWSAMESIETLPSCMIATCKHCGYYATSYWHA
jgi:hypothetical protein